MKFGYKLPFIALMLLLVSCGAKKKVPTQLKYTIGAITATDAVLGGGMLYGKEAGGFRFAETVPPGAPSVERDVTEGNWEFFMVAWEGPGPMEGIMRCAATPAPVPIGGDTAEVSLTLSQANCDARFIDPTLAGDATFTASPLRIVSCANLYGVNPGTANQRCDDKVGASKSYRIALRGYDGGIVFPGLQSGCIGNHQFPNHKKKDSSHSTMVRLPIGGTADLFFTEIIGYEDPHCTQMMTPFEFRNGIGFPGDSVATPAANTRKSSSGVHYLLGYSNNPYQAGGYGVQTTTDVYYDIKYYMGGGTCDCSQLSAADQALLCGGGCPTSSPYDGYLKNGVTSVTPQQAICNGDYTNSNGPNCDAGSITYKRIVCNDHDSNGTADCYYAPNYVDHVEPCQGIASKCTQLNHASIYLADNMFKSGYPPFQNQVPDFSCGGTHCVPQGVGAGVGSGSAGSGEWDIREFHGVVSNFIGTFDGHNPYNNNGSGGTNGINVYTTVTMTGSGSGSDATVWWTPYSHEMSNNNDGDDNHDYNGRLGEIVDMMMGDGVGAALSQKGIHDCASIPTSGSDVISFFEEGIQRNITIQFMAGLESAPQNEWSAAAAGYEKRLELIENGVLKNVMEFNCTGETKSGFYLDKWNDQGDQESNYNKIVYQADSANTARADIVTMHVDTYKDEVWKAVGRFQKTGPTSFRVYESSINRQPGSGSGSGSGSGTGPNWNGRQFYAEADTTQAQVMKFNANRFGDVTLPTKTYDMGNGGIYLRGPNETYNGWLIDWQSSDFSGTPTVVVDPINNAITITANGILSPVIGTNHTVQAVYDEIVSALNTANVPMEVGVWDWVNMTDLITVPGFYTQQNFMYGASMANNILETQGRFIPDMVLTTVNGQFYPNAGTKIEWGGSPGSPTGTAYSLGWYQSGHAYMKSSGIAPVTTNPLRYFNGAQSPDTVNTISTNYTTECYLYSTFNLSGTPTNCFAKVEVGNDDASTYPVFDASAQFNPNWLLNVQESYFNP